MRNKILAFLMALVVMTATVTPTLAACSTGCVLNDTFTRTVGSGWGTASPTGSTYSNLWWDDGSSANGNTNVGSGEGQMSFTSNNSQEIVSAANGSTNYADTDMIVKVEVSNTGTSSGSTRLGPVARRSAYNAFYFADLDFQNQQFEIGFADPGDEFTPQSIFISDSVNASISANTYYWIRLYVNGSGANVVVKAKYWADGSSEPGTWAFSEATGFATTGKNGAWSNLTDIAGGSSASVDFFFDGLQVKDCSVATCDPNSAF